MLGLVPETTPFLAEAREETGNGVEAATRRLIKQIELHLGEDLDSYLDAEVRFPFSRPFFLSLELTSIFFTAVIGQLCFSVCPNVVAVAVDLLTMECRLSYSSFVVSACSRCPLWSPPLRRRRLTSLPRSGCFHELHLVEEEVVWKRRSRARNFVALYRHPLRLERLLRRTTRSLSAFGTAARTSSA